MQLHTDRKDPRLRRRAKPRGVPQRMRDYPKDTDQFMDYCRDLNKDELEDLACRIEAETVNIQNKLAIKQANNQDTVATEMVLRWENWRLNTARAFISRYVQSTNNSHTQPGGQRGDC